jgi:hypothetical protein
MNVLVIIGSGFRESHEQNIGRNTLDGTWVVFSVDSIALPSESNADGTIRLSLDLTRDLGVLQDRISAAVKSATTVYVVDSISCGFISSYARDLVGFICDTNPLVDIWVAHFISIFNLDPTNRISSYSPEDQLRIEQILMDAVFTKHRRGMRAFFEHHREHDFGTFFSILRTVPFVTDVQLRQIRYAIDLIDIRYVDFQKVTGGVIQDELVLHRTCSAIAPA